MKSFKEFLEEKEPAILAAREKNARDLQDWVAAVGDLFRIIKTWLKESDPKDLLIFHERVINLEEPKFGEYAVPAMVIRLEGQFVELRPVARFVRGPIAKPAEGEWTGWVEISNGETDISLLRFTTKANQQPWFIRTDSNHVTLMTKESLEHVFMSLLS